MLHSLLDLREYLVDLRQDWLDAVVEDNEVGSLDFVLLRHLEVDPFLRLGGSDGVALADALYAHLVRRSHGDGLVAEILKTRFKEQSALYGDDWR